jgi:hypothetical protein
MVRVRPSICQCAISAMVEVGRQLWVGRRTLAPVSIFGRLFVRTIFSPSPAVALWSGSPKTR